MKIGLALSGGGYRATVFHLGVLARMAEANLLDEIAMISTVSGGSLAIGLVFSANLFTWPDREQYKENCLHHAFHILTTQNLELNVILTALLRPFDLLNSRARIVSRNIQRRWGIDIGLREVKYPPRWIINSTCFESSRNWRFENYAPTFAAPRMGTSGIGYVRDPDILLSDALAASAGFPVAIGPLALSTDDYDWVNYKPGSTREYESIPKPSYKHFHLWDGGVYDNLGLEPLINFDSSSTDYNYRSGMDTLFISNASGRMKPRTYARGWKAIDRLISIPKYQIEALRSRDTIHRFHSHDGIGRYFKTGNSCWKILRDADKTQDELKTICKDYLGPDEVTKAADFSTTIRQLKSQEFHLLFRHGFEVADCTLHAYGAQEYPLLRYDYDYWRQFLERNSE